MMTNDLFGRYRFDDIPPPEPYRLHMDGEWDIPLLVTFGREYMQVYSFLYVLESAARGNEFQKARLRLALHAYPWKGGWSAVDFFQYLVSTVPPQHRFRIRSIQYGSPGFIEILVGIILVAHAIKASVGAFRETDSAYHERYKHLRKRSMWKMDAREASSTLTRGELAEVEEITRGLSEELRLQDYDELFRELDVSPVVKRTPHLDSTGSDLTNGMNISQNPFRV